MTLEVETVVAVSLMMAVFAAVAAVGTSIVLGAGFERLRAGFEIVSKQTGFFSDAIHKLERKVEIVDEQTNNFSSAINKLEAKVVNVGDQASAFSTSMQKLEKKVEVVDKQTGFFSDAIHKLEQKIDTIDSHEQIVAEKMERAANTDLISTGKAEALVSHAEDLLTKVSTLAIQLQEHKRLDDTQRQGLQEMHLSIPGGSLNFSGGWSGGEQIRYH